MKQTAVEWLVANIDWQLLRNTKTHYNMIVEKAKEMEKEQIIDAHIEGQRVFDKHPHTQWTNDQAELYYNETYKSEKQWNQS